MWHFSPQSEHKCGEADFLVCRDTLTAPHRCGGIGGHLMLGVPLPCFTLTSSKSLLCAQSLGNWKNLRAASNRPLLLFHQQVTEAEWGINLPRSDKELLVDLGLDPKGLPLVYKVGMGILAPLTSWDCWEDPTR